ncbi:hypothetical protein FOA52_007324 [Chlamydomonas sp. UWO 241]|nr:hypothetical protein FOA52_007324 [Chlamydomonas sp. UWO 241]
MPGIPSKSHEVSTMAEQQRQQFLWALVDGMVALHGYERDGNSEGDGNDERDEADNLPPVYAAVFELGTGVSCSEARERLAEAAAANAAASEAAAAQAAAQEAGAQDDGPEPPLE